MRRCIVPRWRRDTALITAPSRAKFKYTAHRNFTLDTNKCTNDKAEYEAIILVLRKLRGL
jgi:ribonuclease HI